jgi:hypothetical protein
MTDQARLLAENLYETGQNEQLLRFAKDTWSSDDFDSCSSSLAEVARFARMAALRLDRKGLICLWYSRALGQAVRSSAFNTMAALLLPEFGRAMATNELEEAHGILHEVESLVSADPAGLPEQVLRELLPNESRYCNFSSTAIATL